MKVWVLLRGYAYEGDDLIGVYSSERVARDAGNTLKYKGDFLDVKEVEVDSTEDK